MPWLLNACQERNRLCTHNCIVTASTSRRYLQRNQPNPDLLAKPFTNSFFPQILMNGALWSLVTPLFLSANLNCLPLPWRAKVKRISFIKSCKQSQILGNYQFQHSHECLKLLLCFGFIWVCSSHPESSLEKHVNTSGLRCPKINIFTHAPFVQGSTRSHNLQLKP